MNVKNHFRQCLVLICLFSLTSFTNTSKTTEVFSPTEPVIAKAMMWHDLVTPDMDKSREFYGSLFGWTFREIDINGLRVGTIYAGSTPIAGVIEVPRANTAVWIKAIRVDDLDARVALVEQNGGRVVLPPANIPGRGTQVIMEGVSGEEFSFISKAGATVKESAADAGNHWAWSELWADDPEAARAFYEKVFEVTTTDETSANQPYWVFQRGEVNLAGMIKNPLTNQGTQWVPYVKAEDPAGITARAKAAGAYVVLEPNASVRDGKVGIFQDPLGALVCVQK